MQIQLRSRVPAAQPAIKVPQVAVKVVHQAVHQVVVLHQAWQVAAQQVVLPAHLLAVLLALLLVPRALRVLPAEVLQAVLAVAVARAAAEVNKRFQSTFTHRSAVFLL